jgi:predicted permease
MFDALRRDVRFGLRQLWKAPGFTATVVLTLALGIGANLTIFLILYGVLLHPLPFPQPQQLVRVERLSPGGELSEPYAGTRFLFMRRASRTLESAAAYDYVPNQMNLVQGNEAVPVMALGVSADFFHVFSMPPQLGRAFQAEDMNPNGPHTAILSDALWRQRFDTDPGILGRTVTLGNQQFTVIGIADPRFRLDEKVDAWVPLTIAENPEDHSNMYNFVARLKPGVTRAQAQDDLKRTLLQFKDAYPKLWSAEEAVVVLDYHDTLVGSVRPALQVLMGAVGLLLAIVAANIVSLLLTRAIVRRRETSLRAALGASSWGILRQALVENSILCVAGSALGLLFAYFALPVLLRLSPLQVPHFADVHSPLAALGFAAGLSVASMFVFSFVPMYESRRPQLNEALRTNSSQVAGARNLPQKILVVGEVALSLMLLFGAALLLTSFWNLMRVSPGFATSNVLTFKTSISDQQAGSTATLATHLDTALARMEALPGVESAAAVSSLPTQLVPDLPVDILGRTPGQPGSEGDEKYVPVTAHYFDAMQIPVVAGRAFNPGDVHGSAPAVIVNQRFVRNYFKNENPLGQHILIGRPMGPEFTDVPREIVGVVGDTKISGLDAPAPGIMFLPAQQIPDSLTRMSARLLGLSWVVRTQSQQAKLLGPLRKIFLDELQTPLLSVQSMQDIIRDSVSQQRFSMLLLCGFGMMSLLLGAAGLYGVMSYNVARRTREIGVRMAVGAERGDILKMVLCEAAVLVGIGLVLGIAASLAGAHVLRSLLFGVAPRNPVALAAMSLLLLATGLFSAWWPARRGAATEPMQALRTE